MCERHIKSEKGVPRERHNKSYTREKGRWEWGEWGTGEGCVGLYNHLSDYETPVASRSAPLDHPNTSRGHGASTSTAVQMTRKWVNMLIFARLIFTPFHIVKIKINHIGFNVGL